VPESVAGTCRRATPYNASRSRLAADLECLSCLPLLAQKVKLPGCGCLRGATRGHSVEGFGG
jgi:hypothetical protein